MNLIDSTPEFVAEAYRKMEQTGWRRCAPASAAP